MEPSKFGDSYDMTKRQVMHWLAPGEWAAHPMWYNGRPELPPYRPFLKRYEAALNVRIVNGESRYRAQFLVTAQACTEHLLLDPDKGLSRANNPTSVEHVTICELVRIVTSPNRQDKLALVYDQSYQTGPDLRAKIVNKLQSLSDADVHAVAYIAHKGGRSVVFIWASPDPDVITDTTQRMRRKSHFPAWRFVDDACGHGHVGN